ncbi:MAG TPA: hypothetical protein VFE07_16550 [Marmoricola sp.]|nr:hypothetical protein [Marmoricola sp.]
MDETDTGTARSPETLSAEAARQLAEQRRAQARAHFDTPTWLGPTRDPAGTSIPEQVEPEHDDLDEAAELVVPTVSQTPIPETAHWAEKARPRIVAGTLLVAALLGVLASLVLTILTQSVGAIAALAGCAFVAVIFRGALMGSGITTVDLKGSVMRIRKGGQLDIINLADPVHIVDLVGTPDQPTWRLRVEAVDGHTVELGPKQVDAAEVHRIVEFYRAVADRARREREARFNR